MTPEQQRALREYDGPEIVGKQLKRSNPLSDDLTRYIVAYGLVVTRNRALEEAARAAEDYAENRVAFAIRWLKTALPVSPYG